MIAVKKAYLYTVFKQFTKAAVLSLSICTVYKTE